MTEALIITPVKDSLDTCKQTIEAICNSTGNFDYIVFNDFSQEATKNYLNEASKNREFEVIHLEDITNTPSPNYKLVLQKAQEIALNKNIPMGIVESDVVVQHDTIAQLLEILNTYEKPGLAGAITVDKDGQYNFPYTWETKIGNEILNTNHSLSFCCTLMSVEFLKSYSFMDLADNKDWFDVHISRMAKKLGFNNYLAKGIRVLHQPHSSRPWKKEKYKNPLAYYLKKLFLKRDRI